MLDRERARLVVADEEERAAASRALLPVMTEPSTVTV
jgi:hypothetical protein